MKQFFKFTFASMLGFILANVIILIIIFTRIYSTIPAKKVVISNTILKIELNSNLPERTSNDPFAYFEPGKKSNATGDLGIYDMIINIRKAKNDAHINGILLDFDMGFSGGYASMLELRNELIDFKKSGKFIYSYSQYYTNKNYFLASVADKIYLNKTGEVMLNGLSTDIMFYKNMLEKIGVEVNVFKCGKFKGAVEPFILEKLSDENRLQIDTYLQSIFDTYAVNVAKTRNISAEDFKSICNNLDIKNADDAIKLKVIDETLYWDQLENILKEKTGKKKNEENTLVTISEYAGIIKDAKADKKNVSDKIAILYLNGEIVDGKGNAENIGDKDIIEAIEAIKEDKKIKGVVLRINSPGGSAAASDLIYRELTLLAKEKPVVASFGNVAASGGYYIAMAADTIISMPNTITGSIGVFGLFPNAQKLMNDKLGITVDAVNTGKYSDMGRIDRPMREDEKAIIQASVNRIYDDFLTVVSKGRNSSKDYISTIAEGRVWTGKDAKEIKLTDLEGGLFTALDLMSKKIGVKDYETIEYPEAKNPLDELKEMFGSFTATASEAQLKSALGENYEFMKQIKNIQRQKGIRMCLPYVSDLY